ncbi:hypothetical protein Tco_1419028 [Tanacetum coccineum]
MAALESCPKHNMIAYLEKTEGNVEFHEVIDFLRRSYIYHALTKGKRFSGKVTPLFDTMLVQPTQAEGVSSERLSAEQSSPSPVPLIIHPMATFPLGFYQAKELNHDGVPQITKLKKQAKPVIKHFKAYLKTVSLQKRLSRKSSSKKQRMHKKYEDAQSKGRTKEMVDEDKEIDEVRLSTEDGPKVSTDGSKVSTDGSKVSTDEQIEGADDQVEGTEENNEGNEEIFESTEVQREGTEEKAKSTAGQTESTEDQTKEEVASQDSQTSSQTPTSMIFGDDETIATFLLNMNQLLATRSLLTLKPLPKIDPKDKGKKKIEEEDESESEDDDIPQAVKKFKQLESDEVMARQIQEEWEAEEERNRIAEEEATNEALIKNFDDIKARIEADRILAEKLQEQERRAFFFFEAIRNRPPTKNQLRNQMMTYLKHVGNFKHSELKSKKFEDIQAMYEKIKRSTEDFIAIGSVEDDRLIKKMKKKDSSKEEEIKQESKEEVKQEDKEEENTRKRKQGTRKKMKSRKRRFKQDTSQDDPSDTENENDELRLCLTIAPDEDKEVDYEILDKKYPIIDWKTENLGTKPQFDESKRLEEINLNVVTRSNGQKRYFSTLMRVLSVFDREDLDAVYKLVMDIYQDKIPEGVHTLMTDEGLVIHMLIEKKYPLKKEIVVQMLKLKLESEEESTMALELIRFIKKSWLVRDQTVLGKDYSNLLIADSLLKTIWFINAPCYDNEALASPNTNEQTTTGKGTSNPLMAGSLQKQQSQLSWIVGCKDPFSLSGPSSGIRALRNSEQEEQLKTITTDTSGQLKILPPKTAEEVVVRERERERKARTTLLIDILEDHLAKFHKMTDAKEMWNAIKSRFGGNDESKKMQKYILKQQFERFTVSNSDGIHKGHERFQSLLSQLEIHGAGVSTEDANQKFLRSNISTFCMWIQVSLNLMSNKPENGQFSNTSGHYSKHEQTSSYSLLASQPSCPQLDHEDLDQVDEYDLEEMDIEMGVAMTPGE